MALAQKSLSSWAKLSRWAYNASGFNKYGLFYDDVLYETEDVEEAIKRLPQKIVDERNYRQVRAAQLSIQKIYLPQNEWVKWEDDIKNRYLTPIVDQVIKERMEREEWDANH